MKWFPQLKLPKAKRLSRIATVLAGALITIAVGVYCLRSSLSEPLGRASYDLPIWWRGAVNPHDIVIVYLDEESARQLNQPVDDVWNRKLQVPLLDRLTHDGARLVVYDIVFSEPSSDAPRDTAFAEAIQRNGKVILGGAMDFVEQAGRAREERIYPPIKPLRKAAAGWGLLAFKPIDPDYEVRQMYIGTDTVATATWRAAEALGAPATKMPRQSSEPRWVNYYGPRDTFPSVSFAQALDPNGVPSDFFRDKIVMVGGRSAVGYLISGRDDFRTPFTRGRQFTPGTEIQSTILLNLLRHEWLTEMPIRTQIGLLIAVALFGAFLAVCRPWLATLLGVAGSGLLTIGGCWLVWHRHVWFEWLDPAAVQIPFAIAWSVGSQYLLESRRRKELRRAFGFYLSPQMADRIADSDFDLRPGGKLVEVTVIFTDLENFTTMTEKLDPAEVSKILTDYFGTTTRCILANRGTIIKYIGDAVFAAWGAPVDDPQHATRAAEAACDLRGLTELQIRGNRLRTRIGIHSGKVLAGNLGSEFRFDYTMIGDAVNFASRLESLNKYLSTQVLLSDAVRSQLPDGRFLTRRLGQFQVAGKSESVVIHELLCRSESQNGERDWIGVFEEGVEDLRTGRFDRARELMTRTREIRGGSDGPSEFYLRKLDKLETNGGREGWTGVVELTEK
ncbi:MAG: CHASE2 domain-containing protein [Chthoniobacterales bacterium]